MIQIYGKASATGSFGTTSDMHYPAPIGLVLKL